jgi:hypothetical protein
MYRLFKKPSVLNHIVVPFNKIQSKKIDNDNIFNTYKFIFPLLKIITVSTIKRTAIPKQLVESMPSFVFGLTHLN